MKKLFFGSVALVALSLGTPAAFAADRPVPAYAPPPPPVYTWSGCYVGASAGTSTGRSQHFATAGSTFSNPAFVNNVIPAGTPITDEFNVSGFIGGAARYESACKKLLIRRARIDQGTDLGRAPHPRGQKSRHDRH